MTPWSMVLGIVVLLGTAALLGLLSRRLGQGPIVGALAAGILLGPGVLGVVESDEFLAVAAELGVTLLLFTVGLEFSWEELRRLGRRAAIAGALQIVLTLVAAALVLRSFGTSRAAAVVAGAMVALSSTATVLATFRERLENDSLHARLATAILLLQDMAVVPLVVIVAALSEGSSPRAAVLGLVSSLAAALGLVAVLYFLSRRVLPRLMGATGASGSRDLPILLSVVTCLGAAWGAHRLQVSPAIGAFMAGLFLAGSPFATRVRADVGALRALFVTVFFTTVGLQADVPWIGRHLPLVLGATIVLLAGKALIAALVAIAIGQAPRTAVAMGLAICQVGEFAFVLAGIRGAPDLLGPDLLQLLVATAVLSLMLTPLLVARATQLGQLAEGALSAIGLRPPEHHVSGTGATAREGHVVVIGLGPAGRGASLALQAAGVEVLAIELNPRAVAQAEREGIPAMVGDAVSEDVLEHAQLGRAAAVIVAIPDLRVALDVIGMARSLAPLVPVVARARYHAHALHLLAAGAAAVADEEWGTGGRLGEAALGLRGGSAGDGGEGGGSVG